MKDIKPDLTGGTKRKLKENAFTAKAESGTLKVKILRRELRSGENALDALSTSPTGSTGKTRPRRAARQPPPDSPPKPRPNRKHVPIFYEPQFRQPIKRGSSGHSHSSSTDESASHSTSSTGVPGIHSTSSADVSAGATASTSSTTSSFVSQLSDVRLQSTSSSGGELGAPPRSNPLFARNDSDGLGTLGELLRPYFPPTSSGSQPSFPLGREQPTRTTSSAGLLVDQPGLSSALHQLASSSASYRSALDAFATSALLAPSVSSSANEGGSAPTSSTATASSTTADTTHNEASGGLKNYRFDPFSALQTAIDHARRASSRNGSVDGSTTQKEKHREIGSPNSNARFYRLEPSGSSGTAQNGENTSGSTSLGAPPELPPAFSLQNSLMGGGIQRFIPPKPTVEEEGNKDTQNSSPRDESAVTDAAAMLGPPPDAPPSFLLQNSLTGGGISTLNLPKTHPSFDRLGSLTRLISQANETAKDLNATLGSPPKANLSLDRLVSLTSVTSEDGEHSKSEAESHKSATTTARTTHDAHGNDSGAIDLGPPPSGPPAFTIGNSLIGGGIDLQPPAASVNTHNFDWKLHKTASTSAAETHPSPAATRGISQSLRARLERTLAASQNNTDMS
ncbi:unnamed protein product [Phytophthora lilii]|uniref:Unnamed protein product n=1 Tax=Phytophthora lilii TaxID=2077276 RepID=A0A9W6WQA6_9STRA|nr:unnamed protein product [Phytophthora lilii]